MDSPPLTPIPSSPALLYTVFLLNCFYSERFQAWVTENLKR